MEPSKSFWQELKQRRVIRVGVVYVVVGWALIEGSETLRSVLELPAFMPRLVLALVVLGLPVALVLAWAFQVTPDGIERAPPAASGGKNVPFVGGVAVGILAVGGLAFIFLGQADEGAGAGALDSGTVVVVPFRVNAPEELSYLGGGFMDLIASRLDGEVGPRAIDPSTVTGAVTRGLVAPDAIARDLGAGLVLTGSVVGTSSGIVANAELVETESGSVRASASAEGTPESVSVIADQLVVQLLSLSEGEYTTSIASLTSTSPDALKEYLLGKQAFREGRYYEGIANLEEALAIDSTFALAAIARQDGATNAVGVGSGGGLERAWRHRDRLSPRDLEYLEARRPAAPRTRVERIEEMERLTRAQPDRIEAWYWLFEAVFHWSGVPQDDAWESRVRGIGDRILAMDPDYYPVIDHMIFTELNHGDSARWVATYTKFYERPEEEGQGIVLPGVFEGLAAGGDELRLDPATVGGLHPAGLTYGPWLPILGLDVAPEGFVAYIDAAVEEARRRVGVDQSLSTVLQREYHLNLALGRLDRAETVREEAIEEGVRDRYDRSTLLDAVWSGVAVRDAEITAQRIDDRLRGVPDGRLTMEDFRDLTAVEIWRFRRDPAYGGSGAAARLRGQVARMPHPQELELEARALLLEAWDAARAGDPAAASAALDRVLDIVGQDPGGGVTGDDFMLAVSGVHEEIDDSAGALESVLRASNGRGGPSRPRQPLILEKTGRMAAMIGDTASAVRAYRRYLTLMVEADAALESRIEEVRTELERLGG
jgi:TolB-like protein